MNAVFILLVFVCCAKYDVDGMHTTTRRTTTTPAPEFIYQCPDGSDTFYECKNQTACDELDFICTPVRDKKFCCAPFSTTTSTTTLFPPGPNYPCMEFDVLFVYDTSSQLTSYERQVDFLTTRVIGDRWTRYKYLRLATYANNLTITDENELKNLTDVQNFISTHKQTNESPSLCELFSEMASIDNYYMISIIFVSYFQGPVDDKCIADARKIQFSSIFGTINLVVLKYDQVDIHLLKTIFTQSNLIFWDIDADSLPFDWERRFENAYECQDLSEKIVPCDTNILVGLDKSQQLLPERFEQQKDFVRRQMLKSWSHFDGLSLWSFADTTINATSFGQYNSYYVLDVKIHMIKQIHENPVLCNTLTAISNLNVINLYVILFVSSFSKEKVDDSCKSAIDTINKKVGGITFVRMTDQVNAADIKTLFSQPLIIPWNMPQEPVPPNWETEFISAYGCDDKYAYPCTTNNLFVAVDKSNYLPLDHFNKQMQFVMDDLFVDEWSRFDTLTLMDYSKYSAAQTNIGELINLHLVRNYFRTITQNDEEPDLCKALQMFSPRTLEQGFLVIFVSKFIEGSDDNCDSDFDQVKKTANSITIISMSAEVNVKRLKYFFPNMKHIPWNMKNGDAPLGWKQLLWKEAFVCDNRSPLIKTTLEVTGSTMPSKWTTKSGQEKSPTTTASTIVTEAPQKWNFDLWYKVGAPILLLNILFLSIYYWRRNKQIKRRRRELKILEFATSRENKEENGYVQGKNFVDLWEIRRENVSVYYDKKLGSGAFADVFLGRLIGDAGIKRANSNLPILASFHDCEVAVKTLPPFADEWARNDFQQEINFMKSLKYHPHILSLLGYVQDPAKPLMILEYCANNSLLSFIRKNKGKFVGSEESELKVKNLVSFAWQVANGLEYLHSLDLLHRDVACRNVLLDKDNICKISDFGLCRTSDNNLYTSKGGKLPIRWMALESLVLYEYSPKSDVWSYGILLFELFSLGSVPYYKMDNEQVLDFLEAGKRLDKPAFCPDEIYEIMLDSWRPDPEERPDFTGICSELMKMLETANESYNYVDAIRNVEVEMTDSDSGEGTVRSHEIRVEIADSDSGEVTVRSHEIQIEMTDSDSGEVTI